MASPDKSPLRKELEHFLRAQRNVRRYWVALSGGLDSCVLLHLLSQVAPQVPVRVLHVNHGLSHRAGEWQALCQRLASGYGYPFSVEVVQVANAGAGLEQAAREARYAAFEQYIRPGDMLLLAHHQDDQAETLLLRLLRGAGLRGLGAMAPVRPMGRGRIGRPLLRVARGQLSEYARGEGLEWVDDESNLDVHFDRNFLRLNILPRLASRWPTYAQRFAQTARLARENEALLHEYAEEDLSGAGLRRERLGQSLNLDYLARLSPARRSLVLRCWISSANHPMPEAAQLARVEDFFRAGEDAQPLLRVGHMEFRRFNNRLYLLPILTGPQRLALDWSPGDEVRLPDGSVLAARPSTAGLRGDLQYHLRLREGGERCRPRARAHSQKLKKLLQEYALEPWLRDRVPLIYAGEQLAAVGDLWVCHDFHVEGERAWQPEWRY